MKKLLNKIALPFMALAFVMLLGACSGKEDSADLLKKYASSKDAFVATFNIRQIVDQSGCEVKDGKLELSDELNAMLKEIPSDSREYIDYVLENEYLVYENAILTFNMDGKDPHHMIFAFNVKNSEKFMEQAGKDFGEKAKEKDDWLAIELNEHGTLLSKDNIAMILFLQNDDFSVRTLEKIEQAAQDKPLPEDVVKRLTEGDQTFTAFAHYEFGENEELPSQFAALAPKDKIGAFFTFNMGEKTWKTSVEFTDYDGKPTKGLFKGTVDPGLLKYSGKDHQIAILVGDAKEYLDLFAPFMKGSDKAQLNAIAAMIDGPAMLSGSVNMNLADIQSVNEFKIAEKTSFAVAVTCTKGRAGELIDMVASQLGVPEGGMTEGGNTLNYIPGEAIKAAVDYPIYEWDYETYERTMTGTAHFEIDIHRDGDLLLLYFNSTPGANKLDANAAEIKGANLAVISDNYMGDALADVFGVKFGISGVGTLKGNTLSGTTTVTGTDKTVLQCYLSLISNAVTKSDEIKSKLR